MGSNSAPVFQQLKVGEQLESIKSRLLVISHQLEALDDGSLQERLEPIEQRLTQAEVKVAVIGQVKAGKSSLINCLTRMPDFLPSDINPWTSSVTQLHFGHPSGKTTGAIFRFFDEEQWFKLATRGGRLGDLTKGLLEEYKRKQLFDQVGAMRERARSRLGDKFESLLGQSREFNSVTPEIMAQFVCVGDNPEKLAENPDAGQYSDITQMAEIFFNQEPFGCPISLIDTPGVNDPLLIWEEITQQSLENSGFFIVVLSAHQSLTRVDMRLIRVLKALNQDQIIVFVNRVDEVKATPAELDKLRRRVRAQLQKELNGKDVPVILGSAVWADYALNRNDEYLDHDALQDFTKDRGLDEQAQEMAPKNMKDAETRAGAFLASGLAQLEMALSEMVYGGAASTILADATLDLINVSRQAVEQARVRIDALGGVDTTPILSPEEKDKLVIGTREEIGAVFDELKTGKKETWDALEKELTDAINDFADEQYEIIRQSMKSLKRGQSYECDLDTLRENLKEIYSDRFEMIRNQMVDEMAVLNNALKDGFSISIQEQMSSINVNTWVLAMIMPKAEALFRIVSLDLTTTWLSGLFGYPKAKIRLATDSIRAQFQEICDEILVKGRAELNAAVDRLRDEFTADTTHLLNVLAGQAEEKAADLDPVAQMQKVSLNTARSDLKVARQLVEKLEKIRDRLDTAGSGK